MLTGYHSFSNVYVKGDNSEFWTCFLPPVIQWFLPTNLDVAFSKHFVVLKLKKELYMCVNLSEIPNAYGVEIWNLVQTWEEQQGEFL